MLYVFYRYTFYVYNICLNIVLKIINWSLTEVIVKYKLIKGKRGWGAITSP